ncbi:MAG TPA: SPOR domain-containing protein [Saprospiraceae bacterium]|nr:SPOR domain-containing protein [Saprospiraceae bacterium]
MNRIITILVTIFILLLLYIWISHVWGSDKPRHPRQIVDAREGETLGADELSNDSDTSLITDYQTEDENSLEDEGAQTVSESEQENEQPEMVNTEPVKKMVVEEQKPVVPKSEPKTEIKKPVSTPPAATKTSQPIAKPASVAASAEGKHMVIVGNFLQRLNADQRLQELKKAGFNDVEIVNFDLSEYHTVVAGRFDDVNEARRLVKKLKDYHKIDAYVRIGS